MSGAPATAGPDAAPPPAGRLTRAAAGLGRAGARIGRIAAATRLGRIAALLLLCLALFLPGLDALPVTDRDEARFAQASRQMLETGDFVDIRFQDEPRWKKPAGIYWLQSAAVAAAGGPDAVGIWAYRLPSLIGAAAGVLLIGWALAPLIGAPAATLAAALGATSLVLAGEANIAKTDAALFAASTAVLGAWARLVAGAGLTGAAAPAASAARARGPLRLILWGALGAAVLLKGPIAPATLAFAVIWLAVAERSLAPVRALGLTSRAPLLFLAIALPWYVAIWIETDGAFFAEAIGQDLIGKMAEGKEAHGAPPGTYLGVAWAVFWPWAPLALLAAPAIWAARRRREVALLLGWTVPFWLALEATPTKLPHYLLPLAPALAGLAALWLTGHAGAPRTWQRWVAAGLFAAVGGALALANIAGPAVIAGAVSWPAAGLGLAGLAAVALGAAALRAGDRAGMATAMVLSALCLVPATLQFGLPALSWGFPSEAMARASAPFAACAGHPAASQSYREPSLVFLQGRGTRFLSPEEAAAELRDAPAALVWIEDRRADRLTGAFGPEAPALAELARVDAFNPNRGKPTTLRLMARAGDPAFADCGAP